MASLPERMRAWLREVVSASRALPLPLSLPAVTFITFALVAFLGLVFTIPPGPLCDEGMWLFMEGGVRPRGLLLHVAVLAALGFVPGLADAGYCDTYYGHPNGNLAQMILEVVAFATLGLTSLSTPWVRAQRVAVRVGVLVALNLLNIGVFHGWLALVHHWTWEHTLLIVATEGALAMSLAVMTLRSPEGVRAADLLVLLAAVSLLAPLRFALESATLSAIAVLVVIGLGLGLREAWRARI